MAMITKSKGYTVFTIFNYILLTLMSLIFLFPYLNMLATSLDSAVDASLGGITVYPRVFTLENFKAVLTEDLLNAAVITVGRVVIGTLIAFVTQFLCAYALTRKGMPGKSFLLVYFTIPMFLSAGLIPQYIVIHRILQLRNTFWVYVLPGAFSMYNTIIIRTYIAGLPQSLLEAARVDGASELRVLWSIVLPLSKPIIATICLWLAVGHWNDWTTSLYYITDTSLYTLQYKLYLSMQSAASKAALAQQAAEAGNDKLAQELASQASNATLTVQRAAQLIVTTLPIICVYPFVQKYFVKGVMIGSVKG